MKISEVKWKTRMTECGPNTDETLTFIGVKSIAAIEHSVQNHDKLVKALESLIDNIGFSHSIHLDSNIRGATRRALIEAKEALKQAKGE